MGFYTALDPEKTGYGLVGVNMEVLVEEIRLDRDHRGLFRFGGVAVQPVTGTLLVRVNGANSEEEFMNNQRLNAILKNFRKR